MALSIKCFSASAFSFQTIAFNGFSMVVESFNYLFQWFSIVMDHWSHNAMVLMDHSPLNFHKIENSSLLILRWKVTLESGIILSGFLM